MPKRRRDNHISRSRKRPTGRRRFKRARRPKRRRAKPLRLSSTVFPDRAVVKHKYICRGQLAPTPVSGTKAVIMRANGMYE